VPSEAPLLDHGPRSLRRLVGLGHALARRGARVFGPDQGTLHVLAACGADVTLLAGPFDPERTAPPRARVLGHLAPPPCRPCAQHHCRLPEGNRCMQFTPAEGVRA
jgi:ADP-heptose:LPS heptosyltransferase